MAKGNVKWFNDAKGYGFISVSNPNGQDVQDVFVHHSAILADGYRTLAEGQEVRVRHPPGRKKACRPPTSVARRKRASSPPHGRLFFCCALSPLAGAKIPEKLTNARRCPHARAHEPRTATSHPRSFDRLSHRTGTSQPVSACRRPSEPAGATSNLGRHRRRIRFGKSVTALSILRLCRNHRRRFAVARFCTAV